MCLPFLVIGIVYMYYFHTVPPLRIRSVPRSHHCRTVYERTVAKARKKKVYVNNGSIRPTPFWSSYLNKTQWPLFVRVIGSDGRLGNHLFEYAAVFGVAHRNKRIPLITSKLLNTVGHYFQTRIPVDSSIGASGTADKEREANFLTLIEEDPRKFIEQTNILPENRNITMVTYLQSRLYFDRVEEKLRRELIFKDSTLQAARIFLKGVTPPKWNGTHFIRVAIHVRRTDFRDNMRRSEGWLEHGQSYFKRSMNYFQQCYDRVQFIILSDDIGWCKANIVGKDVVYSEGLSPGADMALASLCDHAITTVSTFGLWCAWFADGVTIRPLNDTVSNSKAYLMMQNWTQFYPPNTISLYL